MLSVVKAIKALIKQMEKNSLSVGVISFGEAVVEKITAVSGKDLVVAIATGKNVLFKKATATKVTITDDGNITAAGGFAGDLTGDVTGNLEGTLAVHETGDATGAAPTEAEVAAEFGAASEQAKAGIVGIFKVTGGLSYLVVTDKTSYQIVALAEAGT